MSEPLYYHCGLCRREYPSPEGRVYDGQERGIDLSHPGDSLKADGPTCYERWTTYGERPIGARRCYIDDCANTATLVIESFPDDITLCDDHKNLHEEGDF